MKKTLVAVAVASAFLVGCGEEKKAPAPVEKPYTLDTETKKLSYGLGMVLGERLKADFETMDYDALRRGVEAAYAGDEGLMSREEVEKVLMEAQQKKVEEAQKEAEALADKNKQDGMDYMAENAKKPNVTTTDSGLQIEHLTEGEGESPTAEDSVMVHYKGTLIDGTEFDSSYSRGEPVSFPLNGVIPGWTEGLQLMKSGGKARLVIPADLAYGPAGAGGTIGPNATLVFEVELLEINPEG
ncbi:FKBP-type peptidyl-prolyl cis-trans isomerase [Aliamphritea spongicola]|uniref:FKBP-type peptidyl-prolyl cis-trans isomerase n=1 Tax=Aliamphritea spongicola TaxID=707589 RepID=UPI00196AA623|nr:FKBP-type peptidyl-prolyl cis-trans isomerase [Aliamphritea spongicola]MBN3564252.1 FKBP-type peptidyl-prolyl cis-trans isomerase [Aliamphritea spongicola]